ncbi:MAG: S8 family serine peptidase [Candidatus Aureabacteria bacterium]|nr:S8 family serine peptidase [Candidatus Auribacterota bacterium]
MLQRLPDVWAAGIPQGARVDTPAGAEAWGRHRVVLIRGSQGLESARAALRVRGGLSFLNPVFRYGAGEPLVITDEFIACFPQHMPEAGIRRVAAMHGADLLRRLPMKPNTYVLRAGREPLAALTLSNKYVEEGIALFAHPNFVSKKSTRFVPNDPYFPNQWHLCSIGQGRALPGQDVDACAAWDITRGDPNVIIAVIDDGFDLTHEDLSPLTFVPGWDFWDNDSDPSAVIDNDDFHGTAVAGVAAANGNNGTGLTGIAPGCRVMPIRLVAGETSDEQDASAIQWAAEHGAWIISNSWGPPDGNPLFTGDEVVYPLPDIVRAAIDYAADQGRGGKGCCIFWAAGNGNEPVDYDGYASYEKVVAVGACNDQGIRSYYSDYGPGLDLCAPSDGGKSTGIWTTDLMGVKGYNPGNPVHGDAAGNYANDFGGTSSAAPLAAGIAALILSREPDLTRSEVTERLMATADRIDPTGGNYDLSGHSMWYGRGRVDAYSALTGSTRQLQLTLSASPSCVRQGGGISIGFSMRRGRVPLANMGDAYLALKTPAGRFLFFQPDYRLTPRVIPFLPKVIASDGSGALALFPSIGSAAAGRYTLYGVIVAKGTDPRLPSSWLHTPASAEVDVAP